MSDHIQNGTLGTLPDGSTATAYLDRDGTYRTAQVNPVTGGTRVDLGWRGEQLMVVEPAAEPRDLAGRIMVGCKCREHYLMCPIHRPRRSVGETGGAA